MIFFGLGVFQVKEFSMERVKPKIKAQINGVHPIVELHNTNYLHICSNQS